MAGYLRLSEQGRAPRDGWVAATREALGMSVRDLGKRIGIGSSSVSRLEQRERDETVSLAALRKAADGLDCDLVYALVPRVETPGNTPGDDLLDALIMKHARRAAAEDIERVGKTMALENQAISRESLGAQVDERAAALAADPRRLWAQIAARSQDSAGRVK